jgi:beta-glucosidase
MQVHLDSKTGPVICTLHVPDTGGSQNWVEVSAPIQPVKGAHTVYLYLNGPQGDLFNFQSFRLSPESPVNSPKNSSGVEVLHAPGCDAVGPKDPAMFQAALDVAKEADVVVIFAGATERVADEGEDRTAIDLPGMQHELIQAVHQANPNTILAISSTAPVAMNWEQENIPAILGGLPLGEQQGRAFAQVLFGDYNPGG